MPGFGEMSRYIVAVRAPNSGIEGMADGSWHIVTDAVGSYWTERRRAVAMIPYVVQSGGELVMYEIDANDRIVGGVPLCVGRGAKAIVLPEADQINAINEAISSAVHAKSQEHALGGIYRWDPGAARERAVRRRNSRLRQAIADGDISFFFGDRARMALAALGTVVCCAGMIAGILAIPDRPKAEPPRIASAADSVREVRVTTEADYDPRYLASLRSGAYEAVRPVKGKPGMVELVRIYPDGGNGVGREDVIEQFPETAYRAAKGRLAPNKMPWFDPKTVQANRF